MRFGRVDGRRGATATGDEVPLQRLAAGFGDEWRGSATVTGGKVWQ
jgi:hypothetical protein